MTLGSVAAARRRSSVVVPFNIITNGTFDSDAGWSGGYYSGKDFAGGKANFVNSPAYDGFFQNVTVTPGSWYELAWTISNYASGNVYPVFGGGTASAGTVRAANGTYAERILAKSGNNQFIFQMDTGGTLSVDNLSLVGPYSTSTVGGA